MSSLQPMLLHGDWIFPVSPMYIISIFRKIQKVMFTVLDVLEGLVKQGWPSFVVPREMGYLRVVEETTKRRMKRMQVPTVAEAIEGQLRIVLDKINTVIDENDLSLYRKAAEELLSEQDSISVVSAALKMLTKEPDDSPVKISYEAPLPIKRDKSS